MINKNAYGELKQMVEISHKYGLTVVEAETLVVFEELGVGANAADVGRVTGRQGGTVSETLSVLKDKGFIDFEINEFGRKRYATIRAIDQRIK